MIISGCLPTHLYMAICDLVKLLQLSPVAIAVVVEKTTFLSGA